MPSYIGQERLSLDLGFETEISLAYAMDYPNKIIKFEMKVGCLQVG